MNKLVQQPAIINIEHQTEQKVPNFEIKSFLKPDFKKDRPTICRTIHQIWQKLLL